MVLDTSAIVATISGEPEGPRFQEAMLRGPSLAISAVTVLGEQNRIAVSARP